MTRVSKKFDALFLPHTKSYKMTKASKQFGAFFVDPFKKGGENDIYQTKS